MDNLQSGIAAFKSGKREDARKYLIAAVKENPKDENAWGWLYQVANNDNERIECLKKVTTINPNNEKAKQLLDKLIAPPLTPTPAMTNPPQQKQVLPLSSSSKKVNSPSIAAGKNNRKTLTYSIAIIASLCLICLVAAIAINVTTPSQPITPIASQTEILTNTLQPTFTPLVDSGSQQEQPTQAPASTPASPPSTPTSSVWKISGDSWFGCSNREDFEKITGYAVDNDAQAFQQALAAGIYSGSCTFLKNGQVVYITDTAIFSGLIKVRLQGETQEFWTNLEAVK